MSLRQPAHADDTRREEELAERSAFESIVAQAVMLVDSEGMEPFRAADLVTEIYNCQDFQAVLEAIRTEVDQ